MSLPVTRDTGSEIIAYARARCKVENEGFHALKSNGYHLKRNFGRGKQNLAMVFAAGNLLAFAIHTACDCLDRSGSPPGPSPAACRPALFTMQPWPSLGGSRATARRSFASSSRPSASNAKIWTINLSLTPLRKRRTTRAKISGSASSPICPVITTARAESPFNLWSRSASRRNSRRCGLAWITALGIRPFQVSPSFSALGQLAHRGLPRWDPRRRVRRWRGPCPSRVSCRSFERTSAQTPLPIRTMLIKPLRLCSQIE